MGFRHNAEEVIPEAGVGAEEAVALIGEVPGAVTIGTSGKTAKLAIVAVVIATEIGTETATEEEGATDGARSATEVGAEVVSMTAKDSSSEGGNAKVLGPAEGVKVTLNNSIRSSLIKMTTDLMDFATEGLRAAAAAQVPEVTKSRSEKGPRHQSERPKQQTRRKIAQRRRHRPTRR
jgi:hypothetical protein